MTPAEKLAAKKSSRKPRTRKSTRKRLWVCRVRTERESVRLTMKDVSEHVGLSASALCDIEQGTDPQLSTARKLAEFFGKTINELWPERLER